MNNPGSDLDQQYLAVDDDAFIALANWWQLQNQITWQSLLCDTRRERLTAIEIPGDSGRQRPPVLFAPFLPALLFVIGPDDR